MVAVVVAFVVMFIVGGLILWFTRSPNVGDLTCVTGGVGMGKTSATVYWSRKSLKKSYRKYRKQLKRAFRRGTRIPEIPHLYSNMPVKGTSVPLTTEHLMRKTRFTYGSTVMINEVSLVAGSLDVKDKAVNDSLLEFFKLIRHETMGGCLWVDTQSYEDCHFALKRSVSTVLYIQKAISVPFFRFIKVQELHPNLPLAVQTMDTDNSAAELMSKGSATWYAIPKTVFRYYDTHAFSGLTDNCPIETPSAEKTLKVRRENMIKMRGVNHE